MLPEREKTEFLGTVALVGRVNVGKSTLFNRLIGKKAALVDRTRGLTRDLNFQTVEYAGETVQFVDTGGFESQTSDLAAEITQMIEMAIAACDIVCFISIVQEGLCGLDREIAARLRQQAKPVVLAVNKTDDVRHFEETLSFWELGFSRTVAVSSEHGLGFSDFWQAIMAAFDEIPRAPLPEAIATRDILAKIAVVGRPNVGKSSLVNKVLGKKRAIVMDFPGTTRDAVDTLMEIEGRSYVLIDTAGLKRKGRYQKLEFLGAIAAQRALSRADLALFLIDASVGLVQQDFNIYDELQRHYCAVLLLVNKWDMVAENDYGSHRCLESMQQFLKTFEMPWLRISALSGLGVDKIWHHIDDLIARRKNKITTPVLTRQARAWAEHFRTGGIKIRYATQIGEDPPHFLFFTNRPQSRIPQGFRRFLERRLRSQYRFEGIPFKVTFRTGQRQGSRR